MFSFKKASNILVQITNSTPFIEHGKMFIQSENCIFWDFKNHRKRSQYCHWQNWNVTHYFLVTLWSNRICYNRNVTAWCTSAAHIPPNQKTPLHCHTSNLRVNKKDGRMELSKYAWKLREKGKEVAVRWDVRCQPYRSGKRVCDVCNTKKLQILRHKGPGCVNLEWVER